MSDLLCPFFVLFGMLLAVPLCWLAGFFNPLGYFGVPPWRVPPEARKGRR